MNRFALRSTLAQAGLDLGRARRAVQGVNAYRRNRGQFLHQARGRFDFEIAANFPCPADRSDQSGEASGHYFHQDLVVAQEIFTSPSVRHIDVGSRLDGFVAHVASFRTIEVLDIRPLRSSAGNIIFMQRDLMKEDSAFDRITDSLSCLHALEHFGLGRYGDEVNYDGYRVGWDNLVRMLQPGGRFFFSVPIAQRQRVEYDAHRIFSLPFIIEELFAPKPLRVHRFHYVDDAGDLHKDVSLDHRSVQQTFSLIHGCGIFELRMR